MDRFSHPATPPSISHEDSKKHKKVGTRHILYVEVERVTILLEKVVRVCGWSVGPWHKN